MLIINNLWSLFIVMGCFAFGPSDDGRRAGSGRPEIAELLRKAISAAERTPRPAPLIMEIAIDYAKGGRVDEAVKVANSIHDGDYRDAALCEIAAVEAAEGRFEQAARIAEPLEHHQRVQAITLIAFYQVKTDGAGDGVRTIEARLEDLPDRAAAFRLLAQSLESEGNHADAETIYRKLASSSPLDRARALRAAARVRLGAGDFQEALRLAEEAAQSIRNAPMRDPGDRSHGTGSRPPDPDQFITGLLGEISQGLARAGELKEAVKVADGVASPYWRAWALAKLAEYVARSGDRDGAKLLISRAEGLAAEGREPGYSMAEIGAAQIAAGEIDDARDTFSKLLTASVAQRNQGAVIASQAKAGDPEGAIRNAKSISFRYAREQAFGYVARSLAEVGDTEKAIALAEKLTSPDLRALTFYEIGEIQTNAGRPREAAALLQKAAEVDGRIPPKLLRSIARSRVVCGDREAAIRWANEETDPEVATNLLLGVAEGTLPVIRVPSLQPQSQ